MKKILLIFTIISATLSVTAQQLTYYGAGDTTGISISSSVVSMGTTADNILDGSGMEVDYMEATRLLAQASIGYEEKHVQEVLDRGIEGWIDWQLDMEPTYYSDTLYLIWEKQIENFNQYLDRDLTQGDDFFLANPRVEAFEYAWWHVNMNNTDLLRQRVAMALSEIFVVSIQAEALSTIGEGLGNYYDLLTENAFGNFRQLIFDVSMHPFMGFYLSHLNNPKTDFENQIFPDENYAREIMQLFTIGLYELDQNGSRKKDSTGNDIPTYGQEDIKGLAKVFTGLGGSDFRQEYLDQFQMYNPGETPILTFQDDIGIISSEHPMRIYDDWHEEGVKNIVGGNTIPAGQSGVDDINQALDILFNHENVGPFIGRRLIQFLVKSNPSPAYIGRISKVFADNGQGVRGDLKAVVKAILLDEEARSCGAQLEMDNGKLKEPFVRQLTAIRSLDKVNNEFGFYNTRWISRNDLKQHVLHSPSVFNFFLPDYQPIGELANNDLYGPEFQIHDTHSSIGYINILHQITLWEDVAWTHEEYPKDDWEKRIVRTDLSRFDEFNNDFESLINHLDKFYCHGRLSDNTRNIIRDAIWPMKDWDYMYRDHIKTALHLILISPDFAILK